MSTEVAVSGPIVVDHMDPTFSCLVVESKNCRDKRLKVKEAFVPDVAWLYLVIRTTFDQDHSKPLTVEEIRPYVRCAVHAWGILAKAYNSEQGVKGMSPLKKTLSLMARWSAQTLEEKERQKRREEYHLLHKQEKEERRQRHLEEKIARACTRLAHATVAPVPKPKNFGASVSSGGKKKKPDGTKKSKKKQGGKSKGR